MRPLSLASLHIPMHFDQNSLSAHSIQGNPKICSKYVDLRPESERCTWGWNLIITFHNPVTGAQNVAHNPLMKVTFPIFRSTYPWKQQIGRKS